MEVTADDVVRWSKQCLLDGEVPLISLVAGLRKTPRSYTVARSPIYKSRMTLCAKAGKPMLISHAFVVKYATPVDTGNFVPPGCLIPEGVFSDSCQSVPGFLSRVSVTVDCKLDPSFHSHLSALEEWAVNNRDLGLPSKTRMTWMAPSYVATTGRYIVTSQLFQDRGAYNAKSDAPFEVDYEVHPWIRDSTVPNNGDWIPNPDLVQVFDGQRGKLVLLKDSSNPVLNTGDLVKIMFNVVFTIYSKRWLMALNPVQMIRVIESHATSANIPTQDLDRDSSRLLKVGAVLKPFSFDEKHSDDGYKVDDGEMEGDEEEEDLIPWDLTPEPEDLDRDTGSDSQDNGLENEPVSRPGESGSRKRKAEDDTVASTEGGSVGGDPSQRPSESPEKKRRAHKGRKGA